MKVCLLGNMNNNHFSVTRYLRDRGVDATLFTFSTEPNHFDPSADTFDESFRDYCTRVDWGLPTSWQSIPIRTISKSLEKFDVIVGCGLAPAYCHRVGRPLDIFVPYGSDLTELTKYRVTYPNRLRGLWSAARDQRRGIGSAQVFHMDGANEIFESHWRRFRGTSERWRLGIPMVYGASTPQLVADPIKKTALSARISSIRSKSSLIIASHARHVWGGSSRDPAQKGTDRLIKGFAEFRKRNGCGRAALVFFEYGSDVEKSKALIRKLQVQDDVHWFPQTCRRELMLLLSQADVICSEFENTWLSSGVVYEALALAKPILGYRTESHYAGDYPYLYPMLNGRSPREISDCLQHCLDDPARLEEIGKQGREWYLTQVVDRTIQQYLDYLSRRAAA